MTNIAEVSVIVTGSVALGVPAISGWLSALQAERATRAARVDELRSVLDDAAVALLAFMDTVLTINATVDAQSLEKQIQLMEAAARRIWQQEGRIGVRLGVDHRVFKAYRAAHESAGEYITYSRQAIRGAPERSMAEVAKLQAAAYGRFFDVAASLIGLDRK